MKTVARFVHHVYNAVLVVAFLAVGSLVLLWQLATTLDDSPAEPPHL